MNEIEKLAKIIHKETPLWQVITPIKAKQIAQVVLDAGYLPVEETQLEGLTDKDMLTRMLIQ